ncbi:MAG: uroporphyrinogen-III C-methyltransferase [Planctomycetes bacterium]|nr:uroporphyrinogen-III C-methyltransferase [Planctomycetota bacterium]
MSKGKVYLVGAGPGRADLITVCGMKAIAKADCVVCDKLANPALLKYASADAEIIHVPKRIGKGSFGQDQINQIIVEKALAGKTVVRLKGGDPCIFGRGAEEAKVLVQAGIEFEIVPGITAAIAAAEYSGIMLTDRNYNSQIVFVTGRQAQDKKESSIDWDLLAKFRGTIVFYMGMGNIELIVSRLIDNGMDENTPTAIVSNATTADQRVLQTKLNQLVAESRKGEFAPPALIIVGQTASSDLSLNWFMNKAMFGRNIVVTRDRPGNADSAEKIAERGGNAIEFATIAIEPITEGNEFLRAMEKFNSFDWVVFTSVNGVRIFFDFLKTAGKDSRVFGPMKIAAIGKRTAWQLEKFGLKADFVPETFTSKDLGAGLVKFADVRAKEVLLLRSELANKDLEDILVASGANITKTSVYDIKPVRSDAQGLQEQIKAGGVDCITFASPSAVSSFFEQIDVELVKSHNVIIASVGPVTSAKLGEVGIDVEIQAAEHTMDGLLDATENYYTRG